MKTVGVLILGVVLVFMFEGYAVGDSFDEFLISEHLDSCWIYPQHESPVTGGNFVVWSDRRNWPPGSSVWNTDIYGYNLITKTEFPICTVDYLQTDPSVGNNFVVWEDGRREAELGCEGYDIYAYNLNTKDVFPVVTEGVQHETSMDGDVVVYRTGWGVRAYDFSTDSEFSVSSGQLTSNPTIKGNIIAWETFVPPYEENPQDYDIWAHNLLTKETFPVCAVSGDQKNPAVGENIIVWQDNRNGDFDIFGYDLLTSKEFPICIAPGVQWFPQIDGNIVVWGDKGEKAIYGYDLTTSVKFLIAEEASLPDIEGNFVVWWRNDNIYGAYIPEPATLSLLIIGAGLLVWRRRSKKI